MCEIFPEFNKCCLCVSLRIGMMFIAVFAIVTGVAGMSIVIQRGGTDFRTLRNYIVESKKKNDGNEGDMAKDLVLNSNFIVPGGTQVACALFIVAGIILFVAVFTDSEGLVQVFIWVIFIALVIEVVVVLLLSFHCVVWHDKCLLKLDWLMASLLICLVLIYVGVWFYFISVANSYVLQADTGF